MWDAIFGSLVMAFFIFLLEVYPEGVLDNVKSLTGIISMLEDRARVMNNDIIKIDLLISQASELRPDLERVARARKFRRRWKYRCKKRLTNCQKIFWI